MILITGGRAQGKRAFWEKNIASGEGEPSEISGLWIRGGRPVLMSVWTAPMSANSIFYPQAAVGRAFFKCTRLGVRHYGKRNGCRLPDREALTERLFKACPGRVLVTDEIGLGIVPLDPFEREYREETGRICCLLAARSEQVWRVACGLGQRLK